MRVRLLLLAIYLFNTYPSAFAVQTRFEILGEIFSIDLPSQWQSAYGLYGIPLALLGPEKMQKRPFISITPAGVGNISFDQKYMAVAQKGYQEGRERWLKRQGGTLIEHIPYQSLKWKGATEVHALGFRYRLNEKKFTESTYYVVCNKKMFHFKTLLTAEHEKDYAIIVQTMLESFQCI